MEEVVVVPEVDLSCNFSPTTNGVKPTGKCMDGLEISSMVEDNLDQLMTDLSQDKMVLMVFMPLNLAKLDSVDHFAHHAKLELTNTTSLMVSAKSATTSLITLTIMKLEVTQLNAPSNVMMDLLMFTIIQSA
jgi:hypothetical protein